MKRIVLGLWIAALILPFTLAAQSARPDFSGTWNMDMERSASASDGTDLGPITLAIAQTMGALKVETRRGDQVETMTYAFDGTPTAQSEEVTTRSHWDGTSLVADTLYRISGWAVTIRATWRTDAAGTTLIVERLLSVQHGYEAGSQESTNYTKSMDVFKKRS